MTTVTPKSRLIVAIICRETSLTNGKSKDHSPITTSFLSRFLSYQCLFCTDGAGLNDDPISTSTTGQTLNMIFPVEALSPAHHRHTRRRFAFPSLHLLLSLTLVQGRRIRSLHRRLSNIISLTTSLKLASKLSTRNVSTRFALSSLYQGIGSIFFVIVPSCISSFITKITIPTLKDYQL